MSRVRRAGRYLLLGYALLVLAYLLLPVGVVLLFSFNDVQRTNLVWQGFTLGNWADPCGQPAVCEAVGQSLRIGLLSTLVATVLGTMIAFALVRHRFRGRGATNLLLFLTIATPEVVLGASVLTLFLNLGVGPGFWPVVAAHIMFTVSFVAVVVKARLAGFDPSLEEAARDLYAGPWQTFRRVTLPLVAPGVLAAALLGFALSFDDFVITNFNSGSLVTFPRFVFIAARRGIPPEANVIASAVFLVAVTVVVVATLATRRRPA